MIRVIGVDPGTVAIGWGVVEQEGQRLRFVAGGVLRPRGSLPQRLAEIFRDVVRLIGEHQPQWMSLEKSFVGDNVQTAFRLGEARGAILAAAASAETEIAEYAPAEIKVAVAGGGRASKAQMQQMVGHLLSISPELPADQADALGAAICHLHRRQFEELTGAVAGGRPRAWLRGGRR